jgi:6-phosphogluconolactonase
MPSQPELRILPTASDLFEAAAEEFSALASAAVKRSGRFCVALSGGSTPRGLYSLLAKEAATSLPWKKIYFFFGDERHVPPNDADSNYRMANEAMLSKVPVPQENIFRVRAEVKDATAAAEAYEKAMRNFFGQKSGKVPRFDLILLGLGPDGHTASLFPGTDALKEKNHLVLANWVEKFKTDRITFTLPVLNAAACVIFLVSGADKATVLREVLDNPDAGLPSQKVQLSDGELLWMVDSTAASALSPAIRNQASR